MQFYCTPHNNIIYLSLYHLNAFDRSLFPLMRVFYMHVERERARARALLKADRQSAYMTLACIVVVIISL